MKQYFKQFIVGTLFFAPIIGVSQVKKEISKKDSIAAVAKESDRNVMLNAADNKGPRDVNIGLPSSVGGTTIVENGLPVVYYFWPQLPTTAWRSEACVSGVKLLKLGEVAITTGEVGYALDTYTRLGSDKFKVSGQLNGNHFGFIKGSINLTGPIGKGWAYTVSSMMNLDPGTFDMKFKTWQDNTQIHRFGLTKRYKKGEISALYKFARSAYFSNYGPFIYNEGGKVEELSNFRLGRDSYMPGDGQVRIKNLFSTGYRNIDLASSDPFTHSHTVDLFGHHKFNKNLKLNYVFRYHDARSVTQSIRPSKVITPDATKERYYYLDTNEEFTGKVQAMQSKFSENKVPVKSFTSRIELLGNYNKHSWRIGVNEWHYSVDKFSDNSAAFYQEIAPAPRKLARTYYDEKKQEWRKGTDEYGFHSYNASLGYHDGDENRLAIYANDEWKLAPWLTVSAGARLTHYTLKGNFLPYNRRAQVSYENLPVVEFDNNWLLKAFTANVMFKFTSRLGALLEATYNEDRPRLENYSGSVYPDLKMSSIPMGQVGLFYNHEKISIVSALTYIKKTNYQKRLTLTNPKDAHDTQQFTTYYDIGTIGWTTDIVTTPFKNFNLHFLFTLQNPAYKNYSGQMEFKDKEGKVTHIADYDFNDKIVTGVPKVLLEIDPSYTWKNLRVWASARYFSKQYANLTNTLFFQGRWETFAGLSYKLNKNIDVNVTVVNLLNEFGARGNINESDLATDPTPFYGDIVTGTSIRPFTVEAGIRFRF